MTGLDLMLLPTDIVYSNNLNFYIQVTADCWLLTVYATVGGITQNQCQPRAWWELSCRAPSESEPLLGKCVATLFNNFLHFQDVQCPKSTGPVPNANILLFQRLSFQREADSPGLCLGRWRRERRGPWWESWRMRRSCAAAANSLCFQKSKVRLRH